MQEATDNLYSEAYLTLLLRTISSDGISPRLVVELALVLRHADQQTVPTTLVIEFTQAILASVDPQRAINHLLRYLDNVPDIAAFWTAVVQYPEAFVGIMRLSALADCVIQAGLEACVCWLTALYGVPMYTDADGVQHPCGFCVIGMGKLGGYELNFASDVDLMYVYTSYEGSTSGLGDNGEGQHQISNHEYFVTLARRLTTLIGGQGPEGQAFRVDLRLRPEGTQGQLALSLLSYEAYYARLGQTWERMALIKARPVAGDHPLGEEFMALIHPFVYQSHLDEEGVRQLRDMKRQIDAQLVDRAQSRLNVKLGLGGIREIEFLIQLPQLLYGGRQPALQERHSLRALTRLRAAGLMTSHVETTLRSTYCYLRRLEHYLQMEQGAQTHTLPRHPDQQRRLARHCGSPTWEAFYQDYLERTEAVHAIFVEAFQDKSVM